MKIDHRGELWSASGLPYSGDVTARIEPFEAIDLELWRLWGRSEAR